MFGENQSEIDVTAHFDSQSWQAGNGGLDLSYMITNSLEDATFDDQRFTVRYSGSGYNLGLYRDEDDFYWELRLDEANKSYILHYVGEHNDVLKLIAQ